MKSVGREVPSNSVLALGHFMFCMYTLFLYVIHVGYSKNFGYTSE